jgi:hypothetical protein
VQLRGRHPVVCPFLGDTGAPRILTDPFSVCPTFDPDGSLLAGFDYDDFGQPSDWLVISYADVEKSMYWSDEFWSQKVVSEDFANEYSIRGATGSVDAKMDGVWYDTTFVGYIRKNFEWGGFPGWERYADRPEKELQFLSEGLLPI